jgi:hypothetical protein
MRWGVRKSEGSTDRQARKIHKQDKKFERTAINPQTHQNLWMESVKTLKKSGDLQAINNRPEFASQQFRLKTGTAKRELQRKYDDTVAGALMQHLKKNANTIVNRSGTRQFDVDAVYGTNKGEGGTRIIRASKAQWRIVTKEIKQAAGDILVLKIVRDDLGRIVDVVPEITELEQSAMAHYGVKGMRWGVKKAPRPVAAEAAAKREVKARVKKDKISAISNAELQATIRRMQLEQDFKRLAVNEKSQISRMVSSMLLEAGKREVQAYAAKKLTVGAVQGLVKKAATGGVA